MKNKILIIGGGGHAKVLINIIITSHVWEIIGYMDQIDKGPIQNVNWLGSDDKAKNIFKEYNSLNAAIGIGKIQINDPRSLILKKYKTIGFNFPPIISQKAILASDIKIGEATMIFDSATINPGVKIAQGVIINTGAIIEHDCEIGMFSHIAPGAIISGNVVIGKNCMIGTGATITQTINICDNILIGAGAVVINDCLEPGTYVGVPAKRIK